MADTRLVEVATSLLNNLADALTAEGIDVPERQYIHSGEIAHDLSAQKCAEAFIVSWGLVSQGSVGASPQPNFPIRCAMPTLAQFTVVLLRCVPTLSENLVAPSAAKLHASAEEILTDAMTLAKVTIDLSLAKELTELGCTLNGISNLTAIGPFGGVGGSALTLIVDLVG